MHFPFVKNAELYMLASYSCIVGQEDQNCMFNTDTKNVCRDKADKHPYIVFCFAPENPKYKLKVYRAV